jgi:single-strand DNA-binding protein
MNETQVTMVGFVASKPSLVLTKAGRFVANMRVGVTPRRQDRDTGQWSDGDTSYVTVTCWRSLASNVAACLRKGDPVVVKGKMRVRQFDDKDGNQRTTVEVDASTMGHDLTRGVAHFLRTKRSPGDAPPLQIAQRQAVGDDGPPGDEGPGPGQMPGGGWQERDADGEPQPGSGHLPDDEFSAADLFDDAGVEAASVDFVTGRDDAAGEAGDPADPSSGADGVDPQEVGRAA